jgi:predicted DNA-binding transcriptional regulator YafY
VDLLHTAINTGKQVTFKYYEYSRNKTKLYKHNGQVYHFSPYALLWSNDRYYTVGYSERHGKVITFRVDRIAVPKLTDAPAEPKPEGFDMNLYTQSVFQMYDGPHRAVTLKCENSLMKAIVDRFGEDVKTAIFDEEHFTVTAEVAVGPTLFGWVFTSDGGAEILEPDDVAGQYIARILSIADKAR